MYPASELGQENSVHEAFIWSIIMDKSSITLFICPFDTYRTLSNSGLDRLKRHHFSKLEAIRHT